MFKNAVKGGLQSKVMYGSALISLFSFMMLGLLINFYFSSVLDSAAKERTMQAMSQVNMNIENYLQNAQSFTGIIQRNNDAQNFFAWKYMGDSPEELQTKSNIRNLLLNIVQSFPHVRGIALINKNDFFLSNEMFRQSGISFRTESWYEECMGNPQTFHIIKKQDNRLLSYYDGVPVDNIISIVTAVSASHSDEPDGIIIFDVDMAFIDEIISATEMGSAGFVCVMDNDGQIIHSPTNKIIPRIKPDWFSENTEFMNKVVNGEVNQFIRLISPMTGWSTVGVFSLQESRASVANFQGYLIALLIISGLVAIPISAVISYSITKHVRRLIKLMRDVEQGDLSVRYVGGDNDEIGILGGVFNNMLERIEQLLEIVKAEQQSKRQAELLVLREQIKPHFLYNTFDSIQWMAYRRNAPEIVEMVSALSSLFRIGLSGGDEIITLEDEMKHVLNYLTIQKMRYQEKLEYVITKEPRTEGCYVQRLILQPLIENAIYHGIKSREGPGKITINAYIEGGDLMLEVHDDGAGIAPATLEGLNAALNRSSPRSLGYGIFNIHERLRLSYGEDYGVSLFSKQGEYTCAVVKCPCIDENGAPIDISGENTVDDNGLGG